MGKQKKKKPSSKQGCVAARLGGANRGCIELGSRAAKQFARLSSWECPRNRGSSSRSSKQTINQNSGESSPSLAHSNQNSSPSLAHSSNNSHVGQTNSESSSLPVSWPAPPNWFELDVSSHCPYLLILHHSTHQDQSSDHDQAISSDPGQTSNSDKDHLNNIGHGELNNIDESQTRNGDKDHFSTRGQSVRENIDPSQTNNSDKEHGGQDQIENIDPSQTNDRDQGQNNGTIHLVDQPKDGNMQYTGNGCTHHQFTDCELSCTGYGSAPMDQSKSVYRMNEDLVNLVSMTTPPRLGLDQPDFIYSPEVHFISLIDLESSSTDCHNQHLQPEFPGANFPQTSTPFGEDFSDVSYATNGSSGQYPQCESYLDPSSGSTSHQDSHRIPFTIYRDEQSTQSPSSEGNKNGDMKVSEANDVYKDGGYDQESNNAARVGNEDTASVGHGDIDTVGNIDTVDFGNVDNAGVAHTDDDDRVGNGVAARKTGNGHRESDDVDERVDDEHSLDDHEQTADENKDVVLPLASQTGNIGKECGKTKGEMEADFDYGHRKKRNVAMMSILRSMKKTGNGCITGVGPGSEMATVLDEELRQDEEDGDRVMPSGSGMATVLDEELRQDEEDGDRVMPGSEMATVLDEELRQDEEDGDRVMPSGSEMATVLDEELRQDEDGDRGPGSGMATVLDEELRQDEEDGDRVMPGSEMATVLDEELRQDEEDGDRVMPLVRRVSLQGPSATPDYNLPKILITDFDQGTRRYSSSGCVDKGGRPDTPVTRRSRNAAQLSFLSGSGSVDSPDGTRPATDIRNQPDTGTHHAACAGPQPSSSKMDTFQMLMERKAKFVPGHLQFKPKIDLLKLAAPPCKLSPALTEVLTPTLQKNVFKLNLLQPTVETGPPLIIVHSFDGSLKLVEVLGDELSEIQIPCFGIQRTVGTPSDSVENIARHYLAAIQTEKSVGPYRLAGFGFGCMIAMEMALQLQADGKQVESLIMLDCAPLYIHLMLAYSTKYQPPGATTAEVDDALVSGALLYWMESCGPVQRRGLVYGLLHKLQDRAEKILTAVDLTFGDAILSPSVHRTRWLIARHKLKRRGLSVRAGQFVGAAQEIVRLKRKEKATDYVNHILLARHYQPGHRFQGNINLLRVTNNLKFGPYEGIPVDYGLASQCTGKVTIITYDADHGKFLETVPPSQIAEDIRHLLKGTLEDYVEENGLQHRSSVLIGLSE